MLEERPIEGLPHYFARSDGEIVSRKKDGIERLLTKTRLVQDGWSRVTVQAPFGTSATAPRCFTVASLMALAFHGPRPTCRHIAHYRDGNPRNDAADNIEWIHPNDLAALRIQKALRSERADVLAADLLKIVTAIQRGDPVDDIAADAGITSRTVSALRSCLIGMLMKRPGRKARVPVRGAA
jgi:hypothetical protein